MPEHRPRFYVHDDGLYVSIGFEDTNDTILKVGGHDGPAGEGDVARTREWAAALQDELEMLRGLVAWALPYVPEVLPSMESGEFANTYAQAEHVVALHREDTPDA